MKTAISIPDTLFRKADREARRRGLSRSRLYAEALESYFAARNDKAIIQKINEVCAQVETKADPHFLRAQARTLKDEQW